MNSQVIAPVNRSSGAVAALDGPNATRGLGRIRISGALRAFLEDARGVPVYPVTD